MSDCHVILSVIREGDSYVHVAVTVELYLLCMIFIIIWHGGGCLQSRGRTFDSHSTFL